MNWRVVVSVANLVAIALAFFIFFDYPQYSNDAFYLLVAWTVGGLVLVFAFRPRLPLAAPDALSSGSPFPSSGPGSSTSTAPLPSGGLGFCIYCAAPISPGTRACPACGHALPRW